MNDFIELPLNLKNAAKTKALLFGVGINDANYQIQPIIAGVRRVCPYYNTWKHMLERCYCPKYHAKRPTYSECTMETEWLTFSNFKAWMLLQDWSGKVLDKDLKKHTNKHYSPETCLFIHQELNSLLTTNVARRGVYPLGVTKRSGSKPLLARCRDGKGNLIRLGRFESYEEAHKAYLKYKHNLLISLAKLPEYNYVKEYLINYANTVFS